MGYQAVKRKNVMAEREKQCHLSVQENINCIVLISPPPSISLHCAHPYLKQFRDKECFNTEQNLESQSN